MIMKLNCCKTAQENEFDIILSSKWEQPESSFPMFSVCKIENVDMDLIKFCPFCGKPIEDLS